MPGEESSDAKYERLKRQLQDTILREYPNPNREGCPGEAVLRELAARYREPGIEQDPHWHHVTHCSECYREFLGFRAHMKRAAEARHRGVAIGLVATALVIVGAVIYVLRESEPVRPERPQIAELVYRPRVVDLEGRSITRSDQGKEATQPILLGRGPEELTIRLPFGSRAGGYEIQLLKAVDQPLLSTNGEAKIDSGTTSLKTRVDLSKFEPGRYLLGVRRVPWDWTYYPAEIR